MRTSAGKNPHSSFVSGAGTPGNPVRISSEPVDFRRDARIALALAGINPISGTPPGVAPTRILGDD